MFGFDAELNHQAQLTCSLQVPDSSSKEYDQEIHDDFAC